MQSHTLPCCRRLCTLWTDIPCNCWQLFSWTSLWKTSCKAQSHHGNRALHSQRFHYNAGNMTQKNPIICRTSHSNATVSQHGEEISCEMLALWEALHCGRRRNSGHGQGCSSLQTSGRMRTLRDGASSQRGQSAGGLQSAGSFRALSTAARVENSERAVHTPVMLNETLRLLRPQNNQVILDLTFGGGGHCREILRLAPEARILALDRDPAAIDIAQGLAATLRPGQMTPMLGQFSELTSCLQRVGVEDGTVDSVLLDAGASSLQFDSSARGFSLSRDGPLDMRMDGQRLPKQATAADVVNHLSGDDLTLILRKYGEEKLARQISQAIIEARYAFGPITRTTQLANIVSSVFEGSYKQDKLQRQSHVATKTFQALRIFVNDELNELSNGLLLAHRALRPGGKCVALTFHSLEDRIVKRHFHGIDMDARGSMSLRDQYRNSRVLHDRSAMEEVMIKSWEPVSKKASMPSYEEVNRNPRARSAKLRAAVKV